jgi:enamine deaminase RidA (YjgF/YER057c/UK114 family)
MEENRVNISSGSAWEDIVGYSRAVRVGNIIEVSGTTAVDGNIIIGKGDLYTQTKFILQKIEKSLIEAGASMSDVTRTRMYVTDISIWEKAGKAHAEYFSGIRPAATMVEVSRLIDPDLMIEIEVTAVVK